MDNEVYAQIVEAIRDESVNFGECIISVTYRNHHIQKYSITSTKSTVVNGTSRKETSQKKNVS